ncbi:hypothetical protein [Methylocystis echinoides]|uniref:hypothetical protein n=1 Tax=Methylocystis echinoides TaxID=29468 RepID=UPI00343931CB
MATGTGTNNTDFERARRAENPVHQAGSIVAERAGDAAEQIGKSTKGVLETANAAVTSAKEISGQAVDQATNVASTIRQAAETSARENPLMTILMAAGAGFLFGALWRSGASKD